MATPEGTRTYRDRHGNSFAAGYFRSVADRIVSSVGIGTYLGDPTDAVDDQYEQALVTALESGCNVLDTAINYRHQRSERVVGRAIETANVDRDEVFVSTKGGFLAFDGERPADPGAYVREEYIESGLISPDELAAGSHCMAPAYLDDQLDRSLANLESDSVDLYYVHNPETQLRDRPAQAVYDSLEEAFMTLEKRADGADIDQYGIATWDGLRVLPENPSHLSLERVFERAQAAADRVGSAETRFGAVQLPFNAGLPDAYAVASQDVDGERMSALEALDRLGLAAFTSASIAQGVLAESVPPTLARDVPGDSAVERAITFARSGPGVTTSLVGTSQAEHVEANLRAGSDETVDPETVADVVDRL